MIAPESSAIDACAMTRAMSNTCVRRLMAGTVKPLTSPRPRAMYRSWMLADGAPSSWDASQTIQRAASTAPASSLNVAVHTMSRMPPSRKRASSSMTRRSPSTWAMPTSSSVRAATDVATSGLGHGERPPGIAAGTAVCFLDPSLPGSRGLRPSAERTGYRTTEPPGRIGTSVARVHPLLRGLAMRRVLSSTALAPRRPAGPRRHARPRRRPVRVRRAGPCGQRSADGVPLEGTTWQLTNAAPVGCVRRRSRPGSTATLILQDGQAGGSGGCNQWFAALHPGRRRADVRDQSAPP